MILARVNAYLQLLSFSDLFWFYFSLSVLCRVSISASDYFHSVRSWVSVIFEGQKAHFSQVFDYL